MSNISILSDAELDAVTGGILNGGAGGAGGAGGNGGGAQTGNGALFVVGGSNNFSSKNQTANANGGAGGKGGNGGSVKIKVSLGLIGL